MHDLRPQPEKVLLVGVALKNAGAHLIDQSVDELALLAESADAVVVGIVKQRLEKITPATFIGSGKVQEIARLKDETKADAVILDVKLSGVQQRNLKELIGCKVLDRHQLILEIFAL